MDTDIHAPTSPKKSSVSIYGKKKKMFIDIESRSGQKHYINANHIVRVTYTAAMPTAWPENVYLSLTDGTVIDVDMSYADACKKITNY
jgi:hypothetical protein